MIRDQNAQSSQRISRLLLKAGVRGDNSVEVFRFTLCLIAIALGAIALLIMTFAEQLEVTQPLKTLIILAAGAIRFYLPYRFNDQQRNEKTG